MSSKPITLGSRRVAYAVGTLSKSVIADILIDRIHAEVGEDATDEQFAACLQPWLDTISRIRGDKPVSVAGLMKRLDKIDAKAEERKARQPEVDAAIAKRAAEEQRMAEAVAEHNRKKLAEPSKHYAD